MVQDHLMQRSIAALLLLLASVSAALAQQSVVVPATMASIPITGAASAILVPGLPGKSIYVTSVDIVPAVGTTVQFIQGVGALCSAGPSLTGALVFSGGQTYFKGDGYGAVLVLAPGNSLCIIISGGIAPGSLAYAQF
jgi:hypothetical protein